MFFPSYHCRDSSSAARFAATSTNVSSGDSACWARRTATDARRAASSAASPLGCPWTVSLAYNEFGYIEHLVSTSRSFKDLLTDYNVKTSVTRSTHLLRAHFYRPPTKLQEGNIFSRVCLPVCSGGKGSSCDCYPWCIGLHQAGTPNPQPRLGSPSGHVTWLYRDFPWLPSRRHVQTCSLKGILQCWHLVATEARSYSRQVGSTHSTGMLSCVYLKLFVVSGNQCNKDNAVEWLGGFMVKKAQILWQH